MGVRLLVFLVAFLNKKKCSIAIVLLSSKMDILPIFSRLPVEPAPDFFNIESQVLPDLFVRQRIIGTPHEFVDLMCREA
jgi:hypothetical protein